MKFASDGSVEVDGDTKVVVNGGQTRPVTQVETSTDSDGQVTDITLEQAKNTYVESE